MSQGYSKLYDSLLLYGNISWIHELNRNQFWCNFNLQVVDDLTKVLVWVVIKRGTIDSLVRFSADSTLIGPTKEKNSLWPFIFCCLPTKDITIGPIKVVHLSKFTGFHLEISQSLLKMMCWSNKYHNNKEKIGLEIYIFFLLPIQMPEHPTQRIK